MKFNKPLALLLGVGAGVGAGVLANKALKTMHICPRCAESFRRWLWNKKIKDN